MFSDFTHTMKSLNCLADFTTKLSSAGLVYAHYGKEFIANVADGPLDPDDLGMEWMKEQEMDWSVFS